MRIAREKFIADIAGYVKKYAGLYGILVFSPVIAQAVLESGWGESRLASQYHNYFGLKCGTRWTGRSVNMRTQEEYRELRDFLKLDENAKVLLFSTEGDTDPQRYKEIVWGGKQYN